MPNKDLPVNDTTALSPYAALAALTFSCVMQAGAWQIIGAAQFPGGLEFPSSWTDFREGRSTGELEKKLDQQLPARPTLIAIANSVRYLLTGSAGEQVRSGKDGWLFLTDELRFEADGSAHLQARSVLLGAAARRLDQQGVKLIVALVPDKARVHASKLASGHYPAYNSSRYQDALNALRVQGVTVVDLFSPLAFAATQDDVYYHTDTHWNQTGAKVAAEAVASAVKQSGWNFERTPFNSIPGNKPIDRVGDLIGLMGVGEEMSTTLGLFRDQETPVVTQQSSVDSEGSLLGDSVVPVVLTGTSYSLRGNFHGFLQQTLSAKVLNAAMDGGGFLQATAKYLKDDAFLLSKPKLLIWEVPERFLLVPLDKEPRWLKEVGLSR